MIETEWRTVRGERACERARRKEEIPGAEDDMPLSPSTPHPPPERVRRSIRQSPTPLARPPPAPGHFPETDAHERSPSQERFQCAAAAAARLPVRGGPGAPHRRRCCYARTYTRHTYAAAAARTEWSFRRAFSEGKRSRFRTRVFSSQNPRASLRVGSGREEERIPPPPRVFTGLASTHIGRGTLKTGKTFDEKQNVVCDQRKSRNEKPRGDKENRQTRHEFTLGFSFLRRYSFFKRLEFKNYIRIYL